MRKLLSYFLNGLILVVPTTVTLYIGWQAFIILDGLIPFEIPGLGILLIFGFITVVGIIGSYINDEIGHYLERMIKKAPLVNLIYTSVKDLLNAFVGKKKSFNKPVMVKIFEKSQVRRLGFITNDNALDLGIEDELITVYIPHSYAISGNLYLVPKRYVEPLNVNAADLMKYTVSGGVTHVDESE